MMEDMMGDIYHKALKFLTRSSFRSKFKLTYQDRAYIKEKGLPTIRKHALDFITTRIAPRSPKNDGKQTPMRGHPVFVAQHATGTCCRGCIQKWHGIAKGNALTLGEILFITDLIMTWIEEQIKACVDEFSQSAGC
jgi:exodeoxyribonuclease V alpha subunit